MDGPSLMVAATFHGSIAGVVTRQLEHARSFEVTFWRSVFTLISCSSCFRRCRGAALCAVASHGLGAVDLRPVLERDVHRPSWWDHADACFNVLVTMAQGLCSRRWWRASLSGTASFPTWACHHGGQGWALPGCMGTQVRDAPWWAPWSPCACAAGRCGELDGGAARPAPGHAVDLMLTVLVGAVLSAGHGVLRLAFCSLLARFGAAGLSGLVRLAIPLLAGGALRARAQRRPRWLCWGCWR